MKTTIPFIAILKDDTHLEVNYNITAETHKLLYGATDPEETIFRVKNKYVLESILGDNEIADKIVTAVSLRLQQEKVDVKAVYFDMFRMPPYVKNGVTRNHLNNINHELVANADTDHLYAVASSTHVTYMNKEEGKVETRLNMTLPDEVIYDDGYHFLGMMDTALQCLTKRNESMTSNDSEPLDTTKLKEFIEVLAEHNKNRKTTRELTLAETAFALINNSAGTAYHGNRYRAFFIPTPTASKDIEEPHTFVFDKD